MTALDLDRLSAAKLWLVSAPPPNPASATGAAPRSPLPASGARVLPRDLPYLAHALYALIPVASTDVATITCDEWWRIYVNPQWLSAATIPQVGAEVAHAVWHLLSDHAGRARDLAVDRATAAHWNRAADVALGPTLGADHVMPESFPVSADIPALPGLSAEEYYAILTGLPVAPEPGDDGEPHDAVGGCGSGADGIPRPHELGADSDLGAVAALDATAVRRLVAIEYRERANRRGDSPGDALRWVRTVLDPVIPWEPLLAGAVRRALAWASGRGDYTYARPSRRASSVPGVVLPGQHRPVPRIALVVDTSASVDDGLLGRALGEVDGVIEALGVAGSAVTLYSVDAAVHTAQSLRRGRDARLVGAGGTDLRVGLRAIEDQRPRPDVVIVFTDGDTPWPSAPPPACTVIVAVLGRDPRELPATPTWAIRVECLLDDERGPGRAINANGGGR